jgi:phosphoesterase RecJ-like protein
MDNIDEYKRFMSQPRRLAIVTHHTPDADALGSSLALAQYLKKKHHQVTVISPSIYPNFLEWMNERREVLIYNDATHNTCEKVLQEAELVFALDFSTYDRLQSMRGVVENSPAKRFIIDHHQNPEMNADFWSWDVQACSTSELVFRLMEELDDLVLLDVQMAEYIYAGIVTDTSSFKRASTTKKSHLITAHLMDLGVNTNKVQRLIYDNFSEDRLHFIGHILKDKLHVLPEYHASYVVITSQELEEYHTQLGDTEGLVDYAMSVKDTIVAGIFIEKSDCVKVSLRSAGSFAVNTIARQYFNGGGHLNSAAGMVKIPLEKAEETFLAVLASHKKELQNYTIC